MLTPVQPSPVPATTAATALDAVGPSKLPLSPSGLRTTAAVDANLGDTPVQQRAMAAMDFGEKMAAQVGRLADFLGVNLGGALDFAHADVRHLARDLNHHAPDARVSRDTQHLLGDWVSKGGQAFDALRHGLFRNAEGDIGQAARALTRAGVTSPEIQGAMREVAGVLRQVDAFLTHPTFPPAGGIGGGGPIGGGISLPGPVPPGPIGGGPLGPFDALFNHAMAKLNQAMGADFQAHPEHAQALRDASGAVGNAVRQLQQGMTAISVYKSGMMQDLQRLGWTPGPSPLPRPPPLPLPGPQPALQAA